MFIEKEHYNTLFTPFPAYPHHMFLFAVCILSAALMILRIIYNFPFEAICLLVVAASHYASKSKTLIKSKSKERKDDIK
jgi:hypothetical protein